MFILSLLLIAKAIAVDYKFKFNSVDQGFATITGEQVSECQGTSLIATTPEVIALSAFDQKNQFGKFASTMLVNAVAFYAKNNKSRVCVPELATNFVDNFDQILSQNTSLDSKALRTNCIKHLSTFFMENSLLTAVIDNGDSLIMSHKRDGTIIVFRRSPNNEGPGSYLPVFATSDAVTRYSPITFFEKFKILKHDIVIVVNTYIRNLAMLSHFTLAVNLAISAAMNPREFLLPPSDSSLNQQINDLLKSFESYDKKKSLSDDRSKRSSVDPRSNSGSNHSVHGSFARFKSLNKVPSINKMKMPGNRQTNDLIHPLFRPLRSMIETPFSFNNYNENSFGNPHGTIKKTDPQNGDRKREIELNSGIFPFSEIEREKKEPQGTNTYPKYEPQSLNAHAAHNLRYYKESEVSDIFGRKCEGTSNIKSLFGDQEEMKHSVLLPENAEDLDERLQTLQQSQQIEESFVEHESDFFLGTNQVLESINHKIDKEKFKNLLEKILPKHHQELRLKEVVEGKIRIQHIYIQREVSNALSDIFGFESEHAEFLIKNTDPQTFATRISEIVDKIAKHFFAGVKSNEQKKEESNGKNSSLPDNFAMVTGFVVNSETPITPPLCGEMPTEENLKRKILKITEEAKKFLQNKLIRSFKDEFRQNGKRNILI
jgi:hypothetical protein